MTLTDKSRAELEALIAEAQAALEAKAVDPLLVEAREIVGQFNPLIRQSIEEGKYDCGDFVKGVLAALRRGMELASAPAEPVDEAWIERTARECVAHCKSGRYSLREEKSILAGEQDKTEPVEVALLAIRATLAHRGARWPGEDELRDMADSVREWAYCDAKGGTFKTAALEMARRLRAYQTGGDV